MKARHHRRAIHCGRAGLLEQILRSHLYKAHTFKEIAELVSAEVPGPPSEDAEYGVWWFGRKRTSEHSVSEPDGMGGGAIGKLPPPVFVPRKRERPCLSRPTFHAGW